MIHDVATNTNILTPFNTAAAAEKHTKNPLKQLSENGKNVYDY